jgi:anti-sigma factor RsiW
VSHCHDRAEQASLFIDGLLDPKARDAFATHLAECPGCSGLVADLRRIVTVAADLGPIAPPEHVYRSLAAQIASASPASGSMAPPARARRIDWRWAAVAAGLLLMSSVAYVALSRGTVTPAASDAVPLAAVPGSLEAVTAELDLAAHHYERAIAELEVVTQAAYTSLDADLAVAVRASLDALNRAIAESRQALAAEPTNETARVSLFEALRRKVEVLQATALLADDEQQHRQRGAYRVVQTVGSEL